MTEATIPEAPPSARNATCPCGSGLRHKACCGRLEASGVDANGRLDATMQAALLAQRAEHYDEARSLYQHALALSPGLPDALHMLGVVEFAIGDHERALDCLLQAARGFGGTHPPVIDNLALAVTSQLASVAAEATEATWIEAVEARAARARKRDAPVGRVSVVVPSHDHGDYVEAAIASALSQTRPADELVVIDDGSSDGSVARLQALAARVPGRIRLHARERRGAPATINEAIRASTGDWIAVLNSDDRFAPERLERMAACVASSGASLGYSRSTFVGADGHALSSSRAVLAAARLRSLADDVASLDTVGMAFLTANPAVSSGALFFSRDLFDRLGGFRDLAYTHDWDFCLRACLVDEPVFVPQPLYEYRIHGANTIVVDGARADAEGERLLSEFYRRAETMARPDNRFAPVPAVWGGLYHLRILEGLRANLLPAGTVERLADELIARRSA